MHRANLIRCLPLVALVGLGLVLASPQAVAGPQARDPEAILQYLDVTSDIVKDAGEYLRDQDTKNRQALRVIEEAERLDRKAWDFFRDNALSIALVTSHRARDAARQAVRLAREARTQDERAQQRIDRFADYRDQILDRARESGDQRALQFIREADNQAMRAREQYQQGNHDLALHLIDAAEDLLARAARLLFESGGPERLQRELDRVHAAIDRIAARISDNDGVATDLIRSAEEALARAEDFASSGQPLRALQSLRLARRFAGQAASAAGEQFDAETVSAQIDRWDNRAGDIADRVRTSGIPAAATVFDRARHHRDQAKSRLNEGKLELALRQIKAAFDLLREADELTR